MLLGRRGEAVSSNLLPLLLHWAHHKDSMYIMTLGNWNDPNYMTTQCPRKKTFTRKPARRQKTGKQNRKASTSHWRLQENLIPGDLRCGLDQQPDLWGWLVRKSLSSTVGYISLLKTKDFFCGSLCLHECPQILLETGSKWMNVYSVDSETLSSQIKHINTGIVKTTHKVGLYPEGKGAGPGGGALAQKTDFLRGHTLPNFLSLSWKIGISQCLGFFESGGYLKTRFPVL